MGAHLFNRCWPAMWLASLAFVWLIQPSAAAELAQPPDSAAQERAERLIREVYAHEYANLAKSRADLAARLLQQGKSVSEDLAMKFVALRESRDLAADAGDTKTAMAAVETIGEVFAVDSVEMRATALIKLASKATTYESKSALAFAAEETIDQMMALERFASLEKLGTLADTPAFRGGATVFRTKLAEARLTAAEFQRANRARVVLAEREDDAEANLVVGKYLCFFKGDWPGGLPKLAKGSDVNLKQKAEAESAVAVDGSSIRK